jgi:hypothetical protein
VRTRCPYGQCGGGCRACGAIGADDRSRSPCLHGACQAADDAILAGTGSVEYRARAVQGLGLSCMLAPETPSDSGNPFRSVMRWIFDPALPRSVGFGPVCGPLFCGPQADGVDGRPRPVQLSTCAEFVEDDAMKPGSYAGSAPLGEATVDRLPARTEHRGELAPGAA